MIKIMSVEIDGFIIPSQKVKLEFVESNIVCIYGNNGSGKTTFLEILFAVFARDEEILFEYQVNKIKIDYVLDNSLNTVFIGLSEDKDEFGNEYYDFNELENTCFNNVSSLFLGIGRGIHKNELKIPKEMLWHFFRSHKTISEDKILTGDEIDTLTDKLSEHLMPKSKNDANSVEAYEAKALDNKKNIYLPSIDIDTVEALLKSKYKEAVLNAKSEIDKALVATSMNFLKTSTTLPTFNLEELHDKLIYNKELILEMYRENRENGIVDILENIENSRSFLKTLDSSRQTILSTIIKELQSEVELFKEIQVFLDEYNSFLNYDKKLVLSSNGVFIKTETKNHSLQKLSSGERHLLTFFATILLMGEEQDFILLDEPEISLNVDWQRKILSTIAKLAPNSQIIVATHSPLIGRSYRKSVVGLEPKVIDDEE